MNLKNDELQSIKALQKELQELQAIEIRIKSADGREPINKIVDSYATTASLYSNPEKLQAMIDELEISLKRYIKNTNFQGKIYTKKAIEKVLAKSEQRDLTQRKLRLITYANEKRASQRLELALLELEKEAGIFKADIKLFIKNAQIAGFKEKEILAQLVKAADDGNGLVQGFAKRVKSVTVASVRREKEAASIDEYRKVTPEDELWVWVTISTKPCPDCQERAGKVLPIDRWEIIGIPGAGRTICGKFCLCKIIPAPVADKEFPTVREFNIDSKKLVLTTASEERILLAKKNSFNYLKGLEDAKKKK